MFCFQSIHLLVTYTIPNRAHMFAQQAADTPLLINAGFPFFSIEDNGLVGTIMAGDITLSAADALILVNNRNYLVACIKVGRIYNLVGGFANDFIQG